MRQGWELALLFFVRIARFLRAKVRFALFKMRIALVALFVKSE